jgi:hypothetical protein
VCTSLRIGSSSAPNAQKININGRFLQRDLAIDSRLPLERSCASKQNCPDATGWSSFSLIVLASLRIPHKAAFDPPLQ